ncbi:MAG: shikimate dehydrogenase [Lysobacterales bacterium]|jgi:shikimate dehydrogenase
MDQGATLTRFALFGSPVKHSLSPRIHQLFAAQAGISIEYDAIEVSEGFLSREVQKLADNGGKGCNITLPLKNHAFHLANGSSERAELAQAANTLTFKTRTQWTAENTDGPGLIRDLTKNLGLKLSGSRICVVGAGGASAGILYDLLQHQPAELCLFNRTAERAVTLAKRFSSIGKIEASGLEAMSTAEPFELVINATSAGHQREQLAVSPELFSAGACCYDLSYGVAHKTLKAWCKENEIHCYDGLGMLVEQAAESFRIWNGFMPKTAPVRELLSSDA